VDFVLTTASSVHCPTNGAVGTEGQAKLKVAGSPVLRLDGINGKSVSNCGIANSTSTKQCTTVKSVSGAAAKLKVAGAGVALDTLTGATDGTTSGLSASANQTKLKAV
jgi:hypothetical protein